VKRAFAICGLFVFISTVCNSQDSATDAAFGLKWGMSADDTRKLGVVLTEAQDARFGKSYTATKFPKMLSDAELVQISFGYDDKLWHIAAAGKSNQNDPYGSAARQRYDELSMALTEKYGKGKQTHHTGRSYETEHFTMGLTTGNTWWFTDFENATVKVQISISATGFSASHWLIIFEHKALGAAFDRAKKEHEKRAL
jgi:hypothetical protein